MEINTFIYITSAVLASFDDDDDDDDNEHEGNLSQTFHKNYNLRC